MSESNRIVLQSVTNPTIRRLARMRDSNRARRKAGRVLVDGWRETAQAMDAGLELCGLFVPESLVAEDGLSLDPTSNRVWEAATALSKSVSVSAAVMAKISYGQSPRGVVAEFVHPVRELEQLDLPSSPLILVLDKIEKPGNVGAVFRSADAAGIDAVVLCESHDLFSPNAIRSSLGCVFHVPSGCGSEAEVKTFLSSHGIRPLAARVESSSPLWEADLTGPLAVIVGSEADGLANRWQEMDGQLIEGVRIPMRGRVDSLNASVSASVIGFEAVRQRTKRSD